MEASKLQISPEHLRFKPMTRAKRSALRRENIKSLIRSKPAGTTISLAEFAAATQSTDGAVFSMLKTLAKRGEIIKIADDQHKSKYSYVVNEPVIKQAAKPKPAAAPQQPGYDHAALVDKAKDFVWSKNSDSLRDFIEWMGQ